MSPIVGVGAVVIRDGCLLLVRRAHPPAQGSWTLPGGKQRLGETIAEAAKREIFEETGIVIAPRDVIAVVDLIHRDQTGAIAYHYTVIDLLADWVSGEAVAGDDAAEVAWAPLDELEAFALTAQASEVVRTALTKLGLPSG